MGSNDRPTIIVSQMKTQRSLDWHQSDLRKQKTHQKHKWLLRYPAFLAAASLCIALGGVFVVRHSEKTQSVMSHLSAGFEYDETIGRLQFVQNLLPESAMVFMDADSDLPAQAVPSGAQTLHAWSQQEPWLEYSCIGTIAACQDGQVMTVVQNHDDEYTIRINHLNGYESVYSGLHAVQVKEFDTVRKGQQIGTAAGFAAFEWRQDGLSMYPEFSSAGAI